MKIYTVTLADTPLVTGGYVLRIIHRSSEINEFIYFVSMQILCRSSFLMASYQLILSTLLCTRINYFLSIIILQCEIISNLPFLPPTIYLTKKL